VHPREFPTPRCQATPQKSQSRISGPTRQLQSRVSSDQAALRKMRSPGLRLVVRQEHICGSYWIGLDFAQGCGYDEKWEGINMSKFLLTVCAFGLPLSSAFAEENSPQQYREESDQIRLQKIDWGTRIVASGTDQRIGFFYAVNPDCSASGDINIRITKQPE